MSLTLQATTFNKKMEESNPYYNYVFKWFDFAIKYNSAILDAISKAFETFLFHTPPLFLESLYSLLL
ncbi:MAG: hypothetical protein KGI05_06480, partial [Thaumarchaeota archaeon]|nr:hypothetical protein [Nitrososphaerota archaeon]